MKLLFSLLFLLLSYIPFGFTETTDLESALTLLPACALPCAAAALKESPCPPNDRACVCANLLANSRHGVETCILQRCTMKEGLTTKNLTMTMCNAPIRDRGPVFRTVNATLGVLSAVCVVLRIGYKLFLTVYPLSWDDYFIVLALISGVPGTIINDRGVLKNGLGRDIWTLEFQQITDFIKWFYALEVDYFVNIVMLKASLLFFYYHIFPGARVRRLTIVTMVVNAMYGIAFVVTAIFQCSPISYYWHRWDGEHEGTCININALAWANAAVSIALDFWMLAIPLFQVAHLQLAWKKKVGVAMMFCVGTFVTIVSILRLQYLVHFANSTNPTWDQFDVCSWSTIEINVGIMCACMPAIRAILVRLFPKVLGNTHKSSNQYLSKYGSGNALGNSKGGGLSQGGGGVGADRSIITYTKTFEVQRHQSKDGDNDNDEVGLVLMDDLGTRKEGQVKSGNSSEVSV
ncbi:uncharacterized protein EI97DRAFT_449566 [Westerdykella ornata]|uniref:CFEM domain-containing protein n=1 Tax=Westerdykella ornata TaxID=318751 RepID=A0A6A6JR60_WESOR|nr:uncharacterized protein EI97DRAFT_449566 [Westerdykella ornata]KAF2277449.1 hypothetical protein EI97DRAFT_449566 [Westerdykella ornata]